MAPCPKFAILPHEEPCIIILLLKVFPTLFSQLVLSRHVQMVNVDATFSEYLAQWSA